MNLISTDPVAVFATDTHALLFLDGPVSGWFLSSLMALGVESTTAFIESVVSEDDPGLNTRPDGTPAQNVMFLPRGQTTLPSDFPTYQFVKMGQTPYDDDAPVEATHGPCSHPLCDDDN